MKSSGKIIELQIERLTLEGEGVGGYEGSEVSLFNALPEERIRAQVFKQRRGMAKAMALEILVASPFRISPAEDHFLSCSPWQIMDFSYENEWKIKNVSRLLAPFPSECLETEIESVQKRFGYRNKMEFSFIPHEGKISLAFFHRGRRIKRPIGGCLLANENINRAALQMLDWLNRKNVDCRSLKSIILRSNTRGEVIAGLFVRDENFPCDFEPDFESFKGWALYFSNPQCPASVPTREMHKTGVSFLQETVQERTMHFGLFSFFQINPEMFSRALSSISDFVKDEEVLDYYSGVGAISIGLSSRIQKATLVDESEEAIEYAKKNLEMNGLSHFAAHCGRAEKLLDFITHSHVLILDPPRPGLHEKVIEKIVAEKPKKIVYLSCNILTCLDNVKKLIGDYRMVYQKAYNFFPATSHTEFLVLLERK